MGWKKIQLGESTEKISALVVAPLCSGTKSSRAGGERHIKMKMERNTMGPLSHICLIWPLKQTATNGTYAYK